MGRCAQPVSLPPWRVLGGPVGVVHAERWHVPGALLQHVRDRGVVEIKSVLNGIATAVERSVQADSAIGVTCDLFAPAVSLVDNRAQFLDRERRLRDQLPVLS